MSHFTPLFRRENGEVNVDMYELTQMLERHGLTTYATKALYDLADELALALEEYAEAEMSNE